MARIAPIYRFVFYINSFFLVMLVFSFRFIDWGSPASVAATLSVIPIFLTFLLVFIVTRTRLDVVDF